LTEAEHLTNNKSNVAQQMWRYSMNTGRKTTALFVIVVLMIGGCVGLKQPSRKIDFYTLEYSSPEYTDLKPLPFVLRLERVTVAPAYNSSRIVYQEKKLKRNTYIYHRWRANPGDFVTYFLARDLKQSSLFKGVFALNSRVPASHFIEGTVDEFFERDGNDLWEAVLSVSITLMAENEPDISKRVLFQKHYASSKACEKKNPHSLAEAMSRAMAEVSKNITNDVYTCLEKEYKTAVKNQELKDK